MVEWDNWIFYRELTVGGIIILGSVMLSGFISWIALSPLYAWKNSYLKQKVGRRWWAYLLLGPELWKRQRDYTRRELIMAVVLALFIIGAVVVERWFPCARN